MSAFGDAPIDLGDGVRIVRWLEHDGKIIGLEEQHQHPNGIGDCRGVVFFAVVSDGICAGTPTWQVESENPLTLSPSLLCRSCGNHGFIRNGRWERA